MRDSLNDIMLSAKRDINKKKSAVVQGIDPYLNIDDAALAAERNYWMEACGVLIHALRAKNAKNPIKYTLADGETNVVVGNDRISLNNIITSCEDVVSRVIPFDSIEQWRRSSVSDDTILNRFLDQEAKLSNVKELANKQEIEIKELKMLAGGLAQQLENQDSKVEVKPLISWPVGMVVGALLAFLFLFFLTNQ